jgi:hypothetical protein
MVNHKTLAFMTPKQITNKIISSVVAFAMVFGIFTQSNIIVNAAGVNLTITPSAQAVSTTANIALSFIPATGLTNSSTIVVSYPSTYTPIPATLTATDITVTKTGDANFTSAVESGFTATGFTVTLTTAGTLNTSSAFVITIGGGGTNKLRTPAAASNNAFTVSTSAGDFGGALQYVGQANVVQVRAKINPTLSFVIRDSGDTANTNTCDFGTVDTSAVYTCAYRLKVGTNAANGYTVAVTNSGNLTDGSNNITNAAVGTGGSGGTTVTAGVETYGVRITPGTITGAGGTITVAPVYNAGATNAVSYVNTSAVTVLTANKPNNPTAIGNSSLVTQQLGVNPSTPAGIFTKTETYTVTYNF